MREFAKIVVITIFILIVGTFLTAIISHLLKEQQVKADTQKLQELYPNILEGASTGPSTITVNYADKTSQFGSPLVFGGSHSPNLEHQDAWNQIEEIGITSIRKDLFTERAIPNTTIEDYKNNKNGVADIENWNQEELQKIKNVFINAQKRNMTTIGILAYAPNWLTKMDKGGAVPKDWDVFADITRKSYMIHRDNLDYLEIWNEPSFNYFFDLSGTNLSREEAYKKLFEVAVKEIRKVDEEINDGKRIKIGGPVSHTPKETAVLKVILDDPELRKELDFISYHNYDGEHLPEPSDIYFRDLLEEYNMDYLPVLITEWNYMPDDSKPNPKNTGIEAILYTGNKFIGFLQMGLYGANYHVLEPLNLWGNKPNNGIGYYGFYSMEGDKAILAPQARTWRIFSSKLGLGAGLSEIYEIEATEINSDEIKGLGFRNIKGQYGNVIINETDSQQTVILNFENSNINNFAKLQIFNANETDEAKSPVYDGLLKSTEGNISFSYVIPPQTIAGIILTEEKEWFERLPLPF